LSGRDDFAELEKMLGREVRLTLAGIAFKGVVRNVNMRYSSRGGCVDLDLSIALAQEKLPAEHTNRQSEWGKVNLQISGPKAIEGPVAKPSGFDWANTIECFVLPQPQKFLEKKDDDIVDWEVVTPDVEAP
jgi:hypothetical protein